MVERKVINPFNILAMLMDESWDKREGDVVAEDFVLPGVPGDFAGNFEPVPFFMLLGFFREAVFGIFVLTWLPPFRH